MYRKYAEYLGVVAVHYCVSKAHIIKVVQQFRHEFNCVLGGLWYCELRIFNVALSIGLAFKQVIVRNEVQSFRHW